VEGGNEESKERHKERERKGGGVKKRRCWIEVLERKVVKEKEIEESGEGEAKEMKEGER